MDYASYLESMRKVREGITNPSWVDLVSVTPHLTDAERDSIVAESGDDTSVFFAAPALRIRNCFIAVKYHIHNGSSSLKAEFPVMVSRSRKKSKLSKLEEMKFQQQAICFSKLNWGRHLVLPKWNSLGVGKVMLEDPVNLTPEGYPRLVSQVYWAVDSDWNQIVNSSTAPLSVQWDAALQVVSTDPLIGWEIGATETFVEYNCSYCSGGLRISGCSHCGHIFKDNGDRGGWSTPLPPKIVRLLQKNKHVFGMDPIRARNHEREEWTLYNLTEDTLA